MRKKKKVLYDFENAPFLVRKKCVEKRLRTRNNQVFTGFVTDVLPPRMLFINNKTHIIRMFVMEEANTDGHIRSSIALQIPDTFEIRKIEILRNNKTPTTCEYFTKIVRKGDNCFTVCQCTHIFPSDLVDMRLEQKLKFNKQSRRFNRVDDDGYKFPYNY